MNKEFSSFVDPIASDNVVGENIEYDARFIELQRVSEGKPEQQYGDVVIQAEGPDWSLVEKLCNQLLAESKDIRLYCYYTQMLTVKYGVLGFCNGCKEIAKNIHMYWDDIYPKLQDEDGEDDSFLRINSLSLLYSDAGVIKNLYDCYIVKNGLSNQKITIKEANALLVGSTNNNVSYSGGKDRLVVDLQINYESKKSELLALEDSLDYLYQIIETYKVKLDYDLNIEFEKLISVLSNIKTFLVDDKYGSSFDNQEDSLEKGELSTNNENKIVSLKSSNWRDIKILSRKDVELVLEKICIYYEEYEPSHPAPLFIRRIQKQLNMDFYEIVKDISPDSVEKLETVIGINQEKNTD